MYSKLAFSNSDIKEKLKDKKYKDTDSGREIAFSTAYSRGNQKALSDFKDLSEKLKVEEKTQPSEKEELLKKKLPKVKGELPKLDENSIQSLLSMNSWMSKKKKQQLENVGEIKQELEELDKNTSLNKSQKKKQKQQIQSKLKNESFVSYSSMDTDSIATIGKLLKNTNLDKILPKENFEDLMSSFMRRNSEFKDTLKDSNSMDALVSLKKLKGEKVERPSSEDDDDDFSFGKSTLNLSEEEELESKVEFKPVDSIIKEIKSIKDKSTKESKARLGELAQELAESMSIEYTLENVVLNPTHGLPKFKNKKMMTPKAMSKVYAQEQNRYGSLPVKERNIMMNKLEKKIEQATGTEKEVLEKAMDAAVTDVFMSSLKDPESKENKLPKNRFITDPKLMYFADKYGKDDYLEKAAELTRTTDAKVHRDTMSSLMLNLADNEFKEMVGEDNPLYAPFLEMIDPTYCPLHPANERSGTNVDDEDCPNRLSEKDILKVKQDLIDLYQDTTFFIAGGLNLDDYEDETDVATYNEKYKKTQSETTKAKMPDSIKTKIRDYTEGIISTNPDDVLQAQEATKLVNEMRSEVTQHHIDTLGSISVGLTNLLNSPKGKSASKDTKIEWMQSAFQTIPGFPELK
jgi:hypothetical protein